MRTLVMIAGVAAMLFAAAPAALAVTPEPVSFNISVALAGNLQASTTTGAFTASGAISDTGTESGDGRFAGLGHLKTGDPNSIHSSLWLTGANGAIELDLVGQFGQLPAPLAWGDGTWVIADATGSYAGMHGRGSWTAVADFRNAIAHIGPPLVTFTLAGDLN
jgi:hypothetical protein